MENNKSTQENTDGKIELTLEENNKSNGAIKKDSTESSNDSMENNMKSDRFVKGNDKSEHSMEDNMKTDRAVTGNNREGSMQEDMETDRFVEQHQSEKSMEDNMKTDRYMDKDKNDADQSTLNHEENA